MINIEIKTDQSLTRSGVSKKSGQQYSLREQEGWVFLLAHDGRPHPYPTRILLQLEDNQAPFPVGSYVLDPASFFVGSFGKLTIGRIKLSPAQKNTAKAA
ncbi:MAG: helix-destabilizing protein [Gammaproteobacteria bacterium]|nr:helix-destabilizing protein [Gammaproteobacteria bacterium]